MLTRTCCFFIMSLCYRAHDPSDEARRERIRAEDGV